MLEARKAHLRSLLGCLHIFEKHTQSNEIINMYMTYINANMQITDFGIAARKYIKMNRPRKD